MVAALSATTAPIDYMPVPDLTFINDSIWTIDISVGAEQIEAQLVELVEQLDTLGIFQPGPAVSAANDN